MPTISTSPLNKSRTGESGNVGFRKRSDLKRKFLLKSQNLFNDRNTGFVKADGCNASQEHGGLAPLNATWAKLNRARSCSRRAPRGALTT